MDALNVSLQLKNLHCFDEDDGPGTAEPYLWTVFFKIDGDSTIVTDKLALKGVATVVGTPGNHGNLGNTDVDEDDTVAIPAAVGQFKTLLRPISLEKPVLGVSEIGGTVGCLVVLMEEDFTPDSAIAKGHVALNAAVQKCLNDLIPTLTISKPQPTPEDIEHIQSKLAAAVTAAIEADVDVFDWLGGFGNMDDKVGTAVFRVSHSELLAAGPTGVPVSQRWKNEGDWQLTGTIVGSPVQISQQWNWRWCNKCQGMHFAGNPTPGVCPAGGVHTTAGSGNYGPVHNSPAAPGQSNWWWCSKCQGMYFAGNATLGVCPAGGAHTKIGSGNYTLVQNQSPPTSQVGWRWCHKCQGLFFAGSPSTGTCPAGGGHDKTGSGNYSVPHQAA
jgi:hypothetical protein